MKHCKPRWLYISMLSVLLISSAFFTGGCIRAAICIPYTIQLETPPILVTAYQLYAEYLANETAADAKYKGKEIWVTEAIVDSYLTSENENYLKISTVKVPVEVWDHLDFLGIEQVDRRFITVCSSREKFQSGDVVEMVGRCQGISKQGIIITTSRIAKTGAMVPFTLAPGGY